MIHLNIVIPAYNESKRLKKTFSILNSWKIPAGLIVDQITFVNDGSTDSTLRVLRSSRLKFPIHIISYPKNMGKGHAVKAGMQSSSSDYTLLMDADMATKPDQLLKFIPFFKKNVDVIIGTRKNGHSTVITHQPWLRENMGKIFTKLSQIILGVNVSDFTCGFKALSRVAKNAIFPKAQINRWGYDSEILFLANKFGFSIQEKAVVWSDQKNTKVNLLKDSHDSFLELIKIRINERLCVYDSVPHLTFSP